MTTSDLPRKGGTSLTRFQALDPPGLKCILSVSTLSGRPLFNKEVMVEEAESY